MSLKFSKRFKIYLSPFKKIHDCKNYSKVSASEVLIMKEKNTFMSR